MMQFIHFLTSLVGGGGGSGGGGAEESHHHSDDADTATPTRVLWERPLPDPSPGSDDDDGGISVAVVGILDEDDAKRVRTREDLQEEEQQQQDEEDRDALAVMELVSEERPSKQQVLSSGLDHDDDGAASALNDDEKGREAIYEDWVRLHHDIQGMVGDKPVDAPQQQRQILVDEDPINAALCNCVTRPPVSNNAADDWLEMSDDDDDEGLDEEKKSSEQECDECSGGDCSDEDEPSAGQARP